MERGLFSMSFLLVVHSSLSLDESKVVLEAKGSHRRVIPKISCFLLKVGSHYAALGGLELTI